MFFRRHKAVPATFEQRLELLRNAGFDTARQPDGRVKVSRNRCAAMIADVPDGLPRLELAGPMFGEDIGVLVDGGYQKFWSVGGKRRAPAVARQLEALHAFEEDLREALGLESLYNTSLGTTNDLHLYDRLDGRDDVSL